MASPTNIIKYFDNFKGLDLRVSDLKREQGAATEVENVTKRRTGALSKRKGNQINTRDKNGLGLFNHKHVFFDGVNSTPREELLAADNDLNKLSDETFNITYSGSTSAYYEIYLNGPDNNFYFDIYEDNVRIYNKNLGTGKETSFVSIATVVSEVNALTGFSCTSSSSLTTEPAAFIPIAINVTIPTTPGIDITFNAWSKVDAPYDTGGAADYIPFSTQYASNLNNADDILLSSAFIGGCTYFTGTNSFLTKYDGNRVYKAGLDKPTTAPTNPSTAAGALTGDYKWFYTVEYWDAKGNVIESDASPQLSVTGLSSQNPDITIPFIQDTSGYNTDQATVSSGGISTTQTVSSGHKIKQGDIVAVKNFITGNVERHIVNATTSTTLTLTVPPYATLTPATTTNDIISSVVIRVWRTQAGGTLFYLAHEEVNDGTQASFTFTDSTTDANLGAEYIAPVKPRGDTPFGWKYISTWRGTMLLSGKESEANSVIYSDIDSPEYFPDPNNKFDVTHPRGTQIRGIRSLDNILYIFLEEAIASVTGDLTTDSFVVDILSDEGVGCKSPHTIQEIGSSIWFLSDSGVYSISAQGLQEESSKIGPKFKLGNTFNYEQAVAYHWVDERKYVLMMPKTTTNSGNRYTTSETEVFVYDRFWDSWDAWKNIDISGGMVEYDNKIYFVDRGLDSATTTVKRYLRKIHDTGLTFDYADHEEPISFIYKSHWETLGEPSMFKKYRRMKLFSLDASLNDFESESFIIRVQVENDYVPTAISDVTLDFGGGSTGWGSSPWGSFPWGEVRLYTLKTKLNQNRAKSARVVMINQEVNQNVLVSGYELDIVTPYRPEIKD